MMQNAVRNKAKTTTL